MRATQLLILVVTGLLPSVALGGTLKVVDTSFGWDPVEEVITDVGSTPLSKYPAVKINEAIEVQFDEKLKKNSIDTESLRVTTISSSQLPTGILSTLPGGQIAPVSVQVKGARLIIRPDVLATPTSLAFGYVPGAFYRIEFEKGKGGIKSTGGDKLKNTVTIDFRVIDEVAEITPGAPALTVSVVDKKKGAKQLSKTSVSDAKSSFDKATPTPPPSIRFAFSELVNPTSVLNPATLVSPHISIELDSDGNGASLSDRALVPGTFELKHDTKKSTLTWTPALQSIPGESLYVISVRPLIEDLSGNSIYTDTGDIGKVEVFAFRTKVGIQAPLDPIVESFDTQLQRDIGGTSADWGLVSPGQLSPGFGGGTAEDGTFPTPALLADLASSLVPKPIIHILTTEQLDGAMVVPRPYNFAAFEIPADLIVRAEGRFGLKLFSTGSVSIIGELDVSGTGGDSVFLNQVAPGLGGEAQLGGASGGLGGSLTTGAPDFTPTIVGSGFQGAGYKNATVTNQGLTGISGALSDFFLSRDGAFGVAPVAAWDGLFLQPNTGTGVDTAAFPNASPGEQINHNHASFKIDSVAGDTLGVVSSLLDPDYQGTMQQPSLDAYEFPPPPIAKQGDPFVVGDLNGESGDDLGFAGSGGVGSQGLSVAQGILTQVRSGGGGGGGARSAGSAGEDSPTAGVTSGTAGGAGGVGAVTGTVAANGTTTLTAVGTPFVGMMLGGGIDPIAEPPYVVIPDLGSGYVFEIESNTDSDLVIRPIALSLASGADTDANLMLDLDDVVALGGGSSFRVEPSFSLGGAGGAGSGVHLGNTPKFPPVPNLTLPVWMVGAGGGSGGGSVIIEAANRVSVKGDGRILARGGAGGETPGSPLTGASGGGAGGGGSVVLRGGDTGPFAVEVLGLVDARGGDGGAGFVDGGAGGDGRVRIEGRAGLSAGSFSPTNVMPTVTTSDVGFYLPEGLPSAATSLHYNTGALAVTYTSFEIEFSATVNSVPQTGLIYNETDLDAMTEIPFEITFDDANAGPSGNLDPATVDGVWVLDPRGLTGAFIRFRIVLMAGSVVLGTDTYEGVVIDKVTINAEG